ncbi:hypothetical protein EC988_000804 [Linderina pennispora]|nr:hypothetical protein EC988_000804 [Linderina pennispora]
MQLISIFALATLAASLVAGSKHLGKCPGQPTNGKKPNFVVFLTDDQDYLMDSLKYQKYVQKYFIDQGTQFTHYYTTSSTCCPSRVSFLLGKFAHNHNTTSEVAPYGSYYKFQENKLDDHWLPLWLQEENYRNYYIGKFINGVDATHLGPPKGWEHFEPLVSPGIYNFTHPIFSLNGGPLEEHPGVYQTDLISNKSLALIDSLSERDDPFFFVISPTAPHEEVQVNGDFTPPRPADRHKHLFPDAKVPRTPHFNPAVQDKVSWLKDLPLLSAADIEYLDFMYRQRLRSLQATDELVDAVFKRLEEKGLVDNTYFIYTTDNGFHLGHHRLKAGKSLAYEDDVNLPFIIRGPGIAKNVTRSNPGTHSHFPATILDLAGISRPDDLDATSLFDPDHTESFNLEYWQASSKKTIVDSQNRTAYKSLRIISKDFNLYYSVWCSGEREYYNMATDKYQLKNLYGRTDPNLLNRLDALLSVLYNCKGDVCKSPWNSLHKDNKVKSLKDALKPKYDKYYKSLPKFRFLKCKVYYDVDNEGTN